MEHEFAVHGLLNLKQGNPAKFANLKSMLLRKVQQQTFV